MRQYKYTSIENNNTYKYCMDYNHLSTHKPCDKTTNALSASRSSSIELEWSSYQWLHVTFDRPAKWSLQTCLVATFPLCTATNVRDVNIDRQR